MGRERRGATLIVDTSSALSRVLLLVDGVGVVSASSSVRGHLEELPVLVEEVLRALHVRPMDLAEFAVVIGPGGFTGLRIGVSFVSTMASLCGAPVVPLNALDLVAAEVASMDGHQMDDDLLVLEDGRRNEVFWGLYGERDGLPQRVAEGHVRPELLESVLPVAMVAREGGHLLLAGRGLDTFTGRIALSVSPRAKDTGVRVPSDRSIVATFLRAAKENCGVPADRVEILYLRGADAVARFAPTAGTIDRKEPSGQ